MSDLIPFHRPGNRGTLGSRATTNLRAATSLRGLVQEAGRALENPLAAKRLVLEIDVPAALFVPYDRAWLGRVLSEMLAMAVERSPEGGEILVTGHTGSRGTEVEVADDGDLPGSQALMGSAGQFKQFKQLAELHGGRVAFLRCPTGGIACTLTLPPSIQEAAA